MSHDRFPFVSAIAKRKRNLPPGSPGYLLFQLSEIQEGSILNVVSYFTSRHPDFWENPESFDPDRFLPEKTQQRHKFAYIPFGAGAHTCIGKSFALMESITILAEIVRRFHVEFVPEQPIEIEPRFTLRPKSGIKVILRKRD